MGATREDSDNLAAGTWYCPGESVAQNNKASGQSFAHGASSSVDQESQKNTEATWDHYLHMTPDTSHNTEAVFSMVRKIYGKRAGDPECKFVYMVNVYEYHSTLQTVVHLGKDHDTNLHYAKKHIWDPMLQLIVW